MCVSLYVYLYVYLSLLSVPPPMRVKIDVDLLLSRLRAALGVLAYVYVSAAWICYRCYWWCIGGVNGVIGGVSVGLMVLEEMSAGRTHNT